MAANPYGPVTMTDSAHLTDDDWDLSLPPVRYLRYEGTERIKSLCYQLRQHQRCIVIAFTGVCMTVLVAMVIVLAFGVHSERRPTTKFGQEGKSAYGGLEFYPLPKDKSSLISFTPSEFDKAAPQFIRQSLDNVLVNYSSLKQLNEMVYADCNFTYNPANKTCRVSTNMFGETCSSYRMYGYQGGQPCVFIQLNLPNGVTIRPITEQSPLWNQARLAALGPSDPSHVPLTCNGTTLEDRDILMRVKGYGPKGERIMYYPEQGLLTYIYRERNTSLPFLKPGVMVQFTALMTRHIIHITCVAWGQLYNNQDLPIDHKLLTAQFALYINPE